MELLKLCEALSSIDEFKSFSIEVTCSLREKFYPLNFTKEERNDLRGNWIITSTMYIVTTVSAFRHIDSLPQLCRMFMETKKSRHYFLIDWLFRLVLALSFSTATTELAFSGMKLIDSSWHRFTIKWRMVFNQTPWSSILSRRLLLVLIWRSSLTSFIVQGIAGCDKSSILRYLYWTICCL